MPPRITPFSFEHSAFLPGQYATVQCSVPEGDMPLYIKWLFKGVPISEAMGVSITKVGKRISILSIESISAYNAGKYICKADNSAGMAMYATELIVKGKILFTFQKNFATFLFFVYFLYSSSSETNLL